MKLFKKTFLVILLLLSLGILAFAQEINRKEAIVTTGAMWGPPSTWNILLPSPTPGTGGLVYETLFSYNPIRNEFRPWLAESGEWIFDNVYVVKLRKGIKWTDGEAFNAEDVVFTYEIAKNNDVSYSPIWEWMSSVVALDNYTVKFTFSEPHYAEWDKELYMRYIIPEHIWSKVPSNQLISISNANPVGTGPYMYYAPQQDRMIWVRNENWWGNDVFGKPKPKYIIDLVSQSNHITMGLLMKGELDVCNNFIAGAGRIKDAFRLNTWYDDEPYMLSWNTANLYMNTLRKPMDDPAFRRALAFAIDTDVIVGRVYGGMVTKANPTGLFGEGWLEYLAEDVAEEYGFYFDTAKAAAMLDEAGYIDRDGDGYRDMPDGSPIALKIMVPSGWTDWEEAIRVVARSAEAVGINIIPDFPDQSLFDNNRFTRNFDMMIGNFVSTLSANPFDYWNGVANRNIHGERISNGNWGSYDNPELFRKIQEFNITKDEAEKQQLAAEIQKTLLIDMPTIPLWHNGLWSLTTDHNWTNWPDENNPYGIAVCWGNTYQLGMIDVLINIEPAK